MEIDKLMLFRVETVTAEEERAIKRIEALRANLGGFLRDAKRWTGLLSRFLIARAMQGSNSIEGHEVTTEDAIAAQENEEPLDANLEDWRALTGYRSAMTYVLQLANDPNFAFSEGLIRSLHFMMLQYDLKKNPGLWRRGAISVYRNANNEKVYEAPDADLVPGLMTELVETLADADSRLPVIVRAAMAHLNLTMIHPFSDGNGRMARCLQTLVLARDHILAPQFCSIEEYLGFNVLDYYQVLADVGQGSWHPENDPHPWVKFCLKAHYTQAQTVMRRTIEYRRAWDLLESLVKAHGLNERVILALHDATFGLKVRNSTYRAAAELNLNLASRDLKDLADKGLLEAHGEGRGRYYVKSGVLTALRESIRAPRHMDDPFAEFELRPIGPVPVHAPQTSPIFNPQVSSGTSIVSSTATGITTSERINKQ